MAATIVNEGCGKFFTLFIDEVEYHVTESTLTGAEIMQLGGIPLEVGLIQILKDGTEQEVKPDEVIELKPGHRFKKAPRFKRGWTWGRGYKMKSN